jgi:inosine/xanthosine triphosphatase
MTPTIAIGSKNPVKIAAAQAILHQVFPEADFITVEVPSGVPEQPWGDEETRTGALNRARAAREQSRADYGLGLEGGVVETPSGLMTCAWCVMVDTQGRVGIGGGVHILLPAAVAAGLRRGGELGPLMDRLIGEDNTKQKQGAVGILTNGLSNRQTAYEQIVAMATGPFITDFYNMPTDQQA